ncbi:hypothetical protein BVRB_1g022050 [Beta vulgaris subsp. vulgaris]|nr:hypothetical protein BVRB_1g022050 [Beta vulgaris subsp. vulgaris]
MRGSMMKLFIMVFLLLNSSVVFSQLSSSTQKIYHMINLFQLLPPREI